MRPARPALVPPDRTSLESVGTRIKLVTMLNNRIDRSTVIWRKQYKDRRPCARDCRNLESVCDQFTWTPGCGLRVCCAPQRAGKETVEQFFDYLRAAVAPSNIEPAEPTARPVAQQPSVWAHGRPRCSLDGSTARVGGTL